MTSEDLVKLIIDTVEYMDKTQSPKNTRKFQCMILHKDQIYKYGYDDPNVTYQTYNNVFIVQIRSFMDGADHLIYRDDKFISPSCTWEQALKFCLSDLIAHGVWECHKTMHEIKKNKII